MLVFLASWYGIRIIARDIINVRRPRRCKLMIANSGGFVAAFIYPSKDKPEFHRRHSVVLGLLVFAWFM